MTQDKDLTLRVAGGFFGYAKAIMGELNRRGKEVVVIDDRPSTDTISKALIRLNPAMLGPWADAYFARHVESLKHRNVKRVLVIRGQALSARSLVRMRAAWPNAEFILYHWDSFANLNQVEIDSIHLFDHAFSFDPDDAQAHARLHYRPLFYLPQYVGTPLVERARYDVTFIGTLHSDRVRVLSDLRRSLDPNVELNALFYSRSAVQRELVRVTNPDFRSGRLHLIRRPLGPAEIVDLYRQSAGVLDVERPRQRGYTIRTLETIASQRKLITTNKEVASAEFFRPTNILIINRQNPRIPPALLRAPFEPLAPEILRPYGLVAWVDEVLFQNPHRPTTPAGSTRT